MEYFVDYTRITNSGRLSDSFLTVQVKKLIKESKIDKGDIFALVEITQPWFPNSQIGQKIINSLTREYQRSANTSDLVNFELALKKVNKTLAQITQNGETDWIGNLNALLAVICHNSLHISQSGKAEAHLFRENKIIHITRDVKQELQPHPLNTFGDIMSGGLKVHDKMLFASPKLFDYISLEKLRQMISANIPNRAASQIAGILKKEKTRQVNALILEIISKEEAANRVLTEDKEVIYLDQKGMEVINEDLKKYFEDARQSLNRAGLWLAGAWKSSQEFTRKYILPHTKTAWEKTKSASAKGYQTLKSKTAPAMQKISQQIKDKVKGGQSYNIHHYHQSVSQKISPYWKKIAAGWHYLGKVITAFFQWLVAPKNRSILYVLLIIMLLGVLILSIGKLREKQLTAKDEANQKQTLVDAEDKFNSDYKLAILYNDKNKAKKLLEDIISSLEKIKETPSLSQQANDLLVKAQTEMDKLTLTTRLKNGETVAALAQANRLAVTKNNIYVIATGNQVLNVLKESSQEELAIPATAGAIKTIAPYQDEETVLVYTSNQKVYSLSEKTASLQEPELLSGQWANGDDLAVYLGNIYILDRQNGQIYKHAKTSAGYEKVTPYLKDPAAELKNAQSLSIDGSVFVLMPDGSVTKLSLGKVQEFTLTEIPTPNDIITDPKKIYTDADASSIYILDDNRVLEFDKTGKFIGQYLADGLNNISDFAINYKTKKFWFVDSNKIYQYSY